MARAIRLTMAMTAFEHIKRAYTLTLSLLLRATAEMEIING
jgi:hypothetical protein